MLHQLRTLFFRRAHFSCWQIKTLIWIRTYNIKCIGLFLDIVWGNLFIKIVFSLFLWINECSIINHQNWGYGSELDFRITNLNLSVYPMFHEIVREKYGKVITNYNLLLLFLDHVHLFISPMTRHKICSSKKPNIGIEMVWRIIGFISPPS